MKTVISTGLNTVISTGVLGPKTLISTGVLGPNALISTGAEGEAERSQ